MLHPKVTCRALDQLIETISDQDLTDIAQARRHIGSMGIKEYVDTITLSAAILKNPDTAKLVESLTNNQDNVDVAAYVAEIIIALYWKFQRKSAVARTLSRLRPRQPGQVIPFPKLEPK